MSKEKKEWSAQKVKYYGSLMYSWSENIKLVNKLMVLFSTVSIFIILFTGNNLIGVENICKLVCANTSLMVFILIIITTSLNADIVNQFILRTTKSKDYSKPKENKLVNKLKLIDKAVFILFIIQVASFFVYINLLLTNII